MEHEKPEGPMPKPKPHHESELQLLKRTIHNLTVHRDQLMVQNDKLKCELVSLRQSKSKSKTSFR